MNTEYHEIHLGRGFTQLEKRAFTQKKEEPFFNGEQKAILGGALAIVVSIFISWLILSSMVPHHAEAKQQPMTNKELCQMLKDDGGWMPPGQFSMTITNCAKEGVRL